MTINIIYVWPDLDESLLVQEVEVCGGSVGYTPPFYGDISLIPTNGKICYVGVNNGIYAYKVTVGEKDIAVAVYRAPECKPLKCSTAKFAENTFTAVSGNNLTLAGSIFVP